MTGWAFPMSGERLRAARLRAGLSQSQLALRMKVSVGFVRDLEHDRRRFTLQTTLDAARALGVNPHSWHADLVDETPGKPQAIPTVAPMIRKALLRDQTPRERTVEPDDYSQDHPDD